MNLSVIKHPIITEKSMNDAGKGKYTFRVFTTAGKKDIKRTIEKTFKVNVTKVTTVTIKGRSQKTGTRRIEATKQPFKKATVTLKEGQKISIFESGSQK
jgi:large subunit ribosomal protein L23